MNIASDRVAVMKIEAEKKEGYQTVDVQNNSTYKGKIVLLPEAPMYVDNRQLVIGDVVLFAKYSPDTHDIEDKGNELKFVSTRDLLAVI